MPPKFGTIRSLTLVIGLLVVAVPAKPQSPLGATYLGGSGAEGWQYSGATDIVLAYDGTAYVAGVTSSSDFPVTPGAYICTSRGLEDFFVARFNADLTELLAATVIGGSNNETFPNLKMGPDGSVYLAGATPSADFPTTVGAYDRTFNGNNDVFVARFDAELTTLTAATLLGGNGDDSFTRLALDGSGSVVLVGQTASSLTNTFPTTVGAYDRTTNANYLDFFVSRLDANLTQLQASTFIGGLYNEQWPDVAVDPDGNIIVSGATESGNYPSTPGAYGETYHGTPAPGEFRHDVVVSKLSPDLGNLVASTYVGTNEFEGSGGMCLDYQGNIFVSGHTEGVDYPVTPGAFDAEHTGGNEYYVTKLNSDLTTILASTFFTPGDATFAYGTDMTCDASGNLIMVGAAWDEGCPTTACAYDRTFNGGEADIFVRVMTSDLTTMSYGTLLGSPGGEGDACVTVTSEGVVYPASYSTSPDFPVSPEAYDNSYNGGAKDAVVACLRTDLFTRVTDEPVVADGGWSFGASWVDYDRDGYLDLMVSNWNAQGGFGLNYLYHNNGGDTFTRFSRIMTGPVADDGNSVASTWADCDNDGDIDGYVSGIGTVNYFYVNEGGGVFDQVSGGPLVTSAYYTMGAMWVDYDNDGRLDLFVVNHRPPGDPPVQNELFRNVAGVYVKQDNATVGLVADEGNGAAWGDIDGDNDLDLFVTRNSKNSLLYANDGDGTFTLLTGNLLSNEDTHHGNFVDYDNDGDLDMYAGMLYPGNFKLYQNDGFGNFTDVAAQAIGNDPGYWTGGYWGDCDNDGDLDLFVTAHYYYQSRTNRLYLNNGDGTFDIETSGIVTTDSEASSGGVWGDIDRDGDLDLFVTNVNNQNNTLYLNNGNTNHWLEVECLGTQSNRSAIGTKVRVNAHIRGQDVRQLRDIRSQSGFFAQDQMAAHFGLGDATVIDSLKLEWPSGIVQVMENVSIDQFLTVYEPCCEGRVGDANNEGEYPDEVTLGDIMLMVDVKFISSDCSKLPCLAEVDVNQDGGVNPNCDDHITLGDIMTLVDFLFITGPENATLPMCL